jgi:hypothetical protein
MTVGLQNGHYYGAEQYRADSPSVAGLGACGCEDGVPISSLVPPFRAERASIGEPGALVTCCPKFTLGPGLGPSSVPFSLSNGPGAGLTVGVRCGSDAPSSEPGWGDGEGELEGPSDGLLEGRADGSGCRSGVGANGGLGATCVSFRLYSGGVVSA